MNAALSPACALSRDRSLSLSKGSLLKPLFLLILFAAVLYGVHALVRHGEDALDVRQCIERHGPVQTWQKPDGRIVLVCRLEDGRYGVQVRERGGAVEREITSFVKSKLRSLRQVEQYLRNSGARPLH